MTTGRAEPARVALFIAGIDFTDHRIPRDKWPEEKANAARYPFGQVPILEVDGKPFAESSAITRYAGRLSGLYPTDPILALRVDELDAIVEDANAGIYPSFAEQDVDKRIALRKEYLAGSFKKFVTVIDRKVGENGTGWAVGDSITIADLRLSAWFGFLTSGFLDGIDKTALEPYPHITALLKKVDEHPKVAEWNAKHAKH